MTELTQDNSPLPIGIFDSGVGGLSVLQEIVKLLPHEDIIYYADSGNCPYGTRPPAEIIALAERVAEFLLNPQSQEPKTLALNSTLNTDLGSCKALVVACNTASTAAVAHLRKRWPNVPVVGMVPAVKPAAALSRSGVIAVLATEATGQAPALLNVIDRFASEQSVLIVAPPGLVERVEAGEVETPETIALLRRYLLPVLARGADALVLGCTHFPFLRSAIEKAVGNHIRLIDSGEAVARQTQRVLAQATLLNPQNAPGRIRFYSSGDPLQVGKTIAQLLHYPTVPPVVSA